MPTLMSALLHPMPLGRVRHPALHHAVVQLGNDAWFFNPASTLTSTLRALHAVRTTLRRDGHVLVVNSNPQLRPLLREAAHLCVNSNMWFWYDDWTPGALTDTSRRGAFSSARCQPARKLLRGQGVPMANPLCQRPPAVYSPLPRLHSADSEALTMAARAARRARGGRARGGQREAESEAAREAQDGHTLARMAAARLPTAVPGPAAAAGGGRGELALVVVLDLSYGGDVVREAYDAGVPCVSLLNAHADPGLVTLPVYASEGHVRFQHFLLDWLLRTVNLPPPGVAPAPAGRPAAAQ